MRINQQNVRTTIMSSTYGGLGDIIAISSLKQCVNKSINSADLTDKALVDLVVAREIRQDSGDTRDDIDVRRSQQLNQLNQQALHSLLQ